MVNGKAWSCLHELADRLHKEYKDELIEALFSVVVALLLGSLVAVQWCIDNIDWSEAYLLLRELWGGE